MHRTCDRLIVRRAVLALALAACSQDRIPVTSDPENDYNHAELHAAVDKFVVAKRTPEAYAELAKTVFALRAGMDRATADQAELKLVVLALVPMTDFAKRPMDEQIDHLALTVWPTLLGEEIEADEIIRKKDDAKAAEILPRAGETPRSYLERLCGTALAGDCRDVVPESQGHVVSTIAIGRAAERVRIAVADCVTCSAEPGWAEAVRGWEKLDRDATRTRGEIERLADPDNWPIAGEASEPDPGLPVVEINATGEVVIGERRYGTVKDRVAALAEFGKGKQAIALHVRPEMPIAQLRGVFADTRKGRIERVAVLARATHYPWERRIYWLSDNAGIKAGLRTTDTVQLLLHSVDHLGPGAIVRVE
jgi:hypothetical protein